jgi:CRISPR/Cas system-associated protein Csx1
METRFNESDNASKLLQSLITKHEKLREFLIERINKANEIINFNQGTITENEIYQRRIAYEDMLDYLDKEDNNET